MLSYRTTAEEFLFCNKSISYTPIHKNILIKWNNMNQISAFQVGKHLFGQIVDQHDNQINIGISFIVIFPTLCVLKNLKQRT